MAKSDRRVLQTRERLKTALMELIDERGYDAITIQEIVDQANIGRTTFYQHYRSKDDLFMNCHEAIIGEFHSGPLYPHALTREELMSPVVPPGMTAAYRHLEHARTRLFSVFKGQDGPLILQRIRDLSARKIEANLRVVFAEETCQMPIDVLANYLAGAQIAFVLWWLERRQPHRAEDLAQAFYRLQRAAIRDAFGLYDAE